MMKFIVIGIIAFVLLCDSLFCTVMKKKSSTIKTIEKKENSKTELDIRNSQSKMDVKKEETSFVSQILNIADSFTFFLFKIVGYIPSHIIRNFFYRFVFRMSLERDVVIYYGLEARSPWNIKIGKGSIVGDKAILDARHGIEIGENVNISTGVWMWTLQHDINSPFFSSEGTGRRISIGDRAWISSRTTVLPGCNVAEGVVVAAGAVVSKAINEPFTLWGGVPAKKIGNRNNELKYDFIGKHRWFI